MSQAKQKERIGVVVSDKAEKTIQVRVERRVKVPKYGKFIKKSRNFVAHDENQSCRIGDIVKIFETRPLSKTKCWCLKEIMETKK